MNTSKQNHETNVFLNNKIVLNDENELDYEEDLSSDLLSNKRNEVVSWF